MGPDEWKKINDLLKVYYLHRQSEKPKALSERNINEDKCKTISNSINSLRDAVDKKEIGVIQKDIITIIETIIIWIEIIEYRSVHISKIKDNDEKSKEELKIQKEK